MPFTKRQIDAILKIDNHSLIDDNLPLSLRVAETWVKRRAFVMEDEAVANLLKTWRESYQVIRQTASALGDSYRLNTLSLDNTSLEWRRALLNVVDREARKLATVSAQMALQAALKQYLFSYYGKAWAVSQGAPALNWRIPRPVPMDATKRVLRGNIREVFNPDELIYDLLGAEWRDAYEDVLSDMVGKIRNSLTQSINQRLGIDAAARQLAQVMGIDTGDKKAFGRINTITRTYLMGAANSGAIQLYEQNKHLLDGYIFYATMGDGRTCRLCRGYHGTFYAFDDPKRIIPPYDTHYNCVLPGNSVKLPGKLVSGSQSVYDGLAVEILVSSGNRLTVTANHPILTNRGWIKAQFLGEGDNVISCANIERVVASIQPDNNNMPSLIEDVFKSLNETRGMFAGTMPAAPEYFYGDGRFINGDINIVRADSLLLSDTHTKLTQPISHDVFNRADKMANPFTGFSDPLFSFVRDATTPRSFMSVIQHPAFLFRGGISPTNIHRIGNIAPLDAAFSQSPSQNASTDTQFFSERLLALASEITINDVGQVGDFNTGRAQNIAPLDFPVKDFVCDSSLAREFIGRFSSDVTRDQIVKIRHFHYSGYVYDLQVEPYQLYTCNGVIVKNCRCACIPSLKPQAGYDYWLDEPPNDTLWNWLDKMGEWWLIDEFGGKGRKITTPRIGDFEDEPEGEFA